MEETSRFYVLSGWGFQQAKDFCERRDALLP